MALDLVIFDNTPVTILKIKGAGKFLARLLTSDVSKLAVGGVERTVAMTATGGVLGTLWAARTALDAYELILVGEETDALQAWIRQVSVAFEAEVGCETLSGFYFVGKFPVDGIHLEPAHMVESLGMRFIDMGWMCLAVGPKENIEAMSCNLLKAGAKKGEKTGWDALRIFAREPAAGLELDEGSSPLETGLEDALDFDDPDRIFIGRALTEARFKAGAYERMQLVAFDVAFDPNLLVEVPNVIVGDTAYPCTSIARVPEGPFTVALVRLPQSVNIGDSVPVDVKTDPRTQCEAALVIDKQI